MSTDMNMGHETWEDAKRRVVPVLKPVEYFRSGGPAQHQLRIDWVGDVMICYALRSKKLFRFVTDWPDYAEWTLARLVRSPLFAWTAERADDWRRPWPGFTSTRYEAKAKQAGRTPCYLVFQRAG